MQNTEQYLRAQSISTLHDIQGWVIGEHIRQLEDELKKFNPNQPRVPRGNSDGGQWTGGGGGSGIIARQPKPEETTPPFIPDSTGGIDIGNILAGPLGKIIGDALKLPESNPITQLLTGLALSTLGVQNNNTTKLPPMSLVEGDGNGSPIGNVDPSLVIPILGNVFSLLGNITSTVGNIFGNLFGISSAQAAEITPDGHVLSDKITRQMPGRGVTVPDIDDAVRSGDRIDAINKGTGGDATRYVIPRTQQSVVIDNSTKKVLQVGGPIFEHGERSGDKPGAVMRPAPRSGGGGGRGGGGTGGTGMGQGRYTGPLRGPFDLPKL